MVKSIQTTLVIQFMIKIKDHVHLSTKVGEDFYNNFKSEFNFNIDLLSSIDYLYEDKNLKIFKFNTNI